nr:glycosyltransferase family 2 protein [uncultured Anaerotignum sp.]
MNKKVYIILLNYRGFEDTSSCIDSLHQIDYPSYEVVVVDNCSNDGSYEQLREKYSDCIFLLAPGNDGFSAGNNIGIHYALDHGADYVLMLNNDTVVKPDFLTRMMESVNEDTVVTPTIYYYDEPRKIWYADGKINFNRCTVSNGSDQKGKYCNYASGCCLLMSRKVLETVGDWAEEYFMYYEDMDYSLRIIQSGFKIYYENTAVVYHKAGRSAGKKSKLSIYYNVRNRLYIIQKFHFPRKSFFFTVITRWIRYIQGCLRKNNERISLKAMQDYFFNRMGQQELQ